MATNPYLARAEQLQDQRWDNRLKQQLAPLTQSIAADQARLSTLIDVNGLPKPESKQEYETIENRLAQTIGQVRTLYGDKMPSDHPGRLSETVGHIRNWLKLPGKTPQEKLAAWKQQNQTQAGQYATGALPYGQTLPGQEEAQKTADALKLIEARNANAGWTSKGEPVRVGDKWFQPFTNKAGQTKMEPMPEGYNGPTPKAMTDYQKSLTDYREKVLALQEARQKAASDPNSPTARAALLRAEGEAERSHAYMIRALAGATGTDLSGKPLPGALETPGGTPIGSMFSSNFYKSAQGIAQLNDAQGAINQVGGAVQKLYSSGGSLADPNVAAALANPTWTAAKLLQGIVGQELTPEQREAVVAIRSAQENIQGMRKAAGGGLSNEQVNRLEAQLPGPNTPNLEFAQTQLEYLNLTLSRLSQGVPSAEGGATFQGPEGPVHKKNMEAKKKSGTANRIRVRLSDGTTGTIDENEFDASTMTKVK
jgi:hypothetical protein